MKVTRKTTESKITVTIGDTLTPDYRKKIRTPSAFLNHMIEHIAYRFGRNIECELELADFTLDHLVFEDLGITLGRAVNELLKTQDCVPGFGDSAGIIDEANAHVYLSFENRAYFELSQAVTIPVEAEDCKAEDLAAFLEGFAQGAVCTVQAEIRKGVNSHHIWESVFRAFGSALKEVFRYDDSRKGLTAGVAGAITFEVENK